MGLLDDAASVISRKSTHSHSNNRRHSSSHKRRSTQSTRSHRSRSRTRSPGARSIAASFFGGGDDDHHHHNRHHYPKHNSSRASFFGLPNVSTRSFFGGDKHRSSTSSYRRSPRPNFLTRAYKQLKRLLRDLVYYAKRHPLKVFTLVILPLITGGALTALLARFGLRLPPSIERMMGLGARMAGGGTTATLVGEAVRMMGSDGGHVRVERGRDGGLQWERKRWEGSDYDAGWGGGMMKTVRDFFD